MYKQKLTVILMIFLLLSPIAAQTASETAKVAGIYSAPKEDIDKIKDEGINRSQVMQTLSYMTDVIGPRLTGSPGLKRANEWTRDTLSKWGLENAQLEPWGPFGRGWTLKKFYAMVDGPTAFPLIAYPKAWSPGTDTLIAAPTVSVKKGQKLSPQTAPANTAYTAEVVRFTATKEEDLEQYRGKLKGKIVLIGQIRETKAHFTPEAKRSTDKELLDLADAQDPALIPRPQPAGQNNFAQQMQFSNTRMRFLANEGAAILIDAGRGDGGTIFVQQATAVQPLPSTDGTPSGSPARLYDKGTNIPIQISAAVEHFNRIARMIDAGEKVTMTVDLAVEYQDQDPMAYNTIAEIPGTDLKDEIVMLGGHLDSWQSATGATDNGAGCAVMMEAVRILKTLGLKPRRTIRIALWSGEEQGLLGSRAYVRKHFAYRGDPNAPLFGGGGGGGQNAAQQSLTKLPEYDKLSAYFNIDNGTGKIRGVYMQGNNNVRPVFKTWLNHFKDPKWWKADFDPAKDTSMAANTLTIANTGGTDHLAFDAVGLPGFQFIQDTIEYDTRTHHSNMDVFDRIQADDMKQMSIIVAAFVYQTAMMDEKMPRKPMR
ncbi:MAG: M20/M25/M40 family metallo-hydrolase [Chloracidobacterium sp.]|nr:M20/M25/M40 family metallo-hydrolase [Chloracidobacterium sp.]